MHLPDASGLFSNARLDIPEQSQQNLQRRQLFENVILMLLAVYLLVDTVNGFFVTLSLPNVVSAVYKQGMLGLILLFAYQFEPQRFLWCLAWLMGIFAWATLRFFLVDDLDSLYAFQESIKVIYLFIIVLVVSTFHTLTPEKLRFMLLFSIAVVALNVGLSLLGLGLTTYHSFGAKGFFYSGNALSGVIVICASFMLMRAFTQSILVFALITLGLSAIALLIGTKGGFLGVLVCALLTILFNMNLRALLYGLVVTCIAALLVYILAEQLQQHPLYERVIFFYENGGLTRVIFSGRDGKLTRILPVLLKADFWQLMLGLDMSEMLKIAGIRRAEFDWFDMQITFGILLSIFVYLSYVVLFSKLLVTPKNYVVRAAICAFIVLFIVSAVAGHVLYNGMVTPLWAMLIAASFNHNVQALVQKQFAEGKVLSGEE